MASAAFYIWAKKNEPRGSFFSGNRDTGHPLTLGLFRKERREYRGDESKTTMINNSDSFFAEPINPRLEARALALEVICRLLLWMADGATLEDRGLRTSVALYCVRPDLVDGRTLEQIGALSGRTKQTVHKLADIFRLTTGLKP